jgi:hypothetical protein
VLPEWVQALGQAQQQLQLMGKDGSVLSKDTTSLKFVFQLSKRSASVYPHEFGFQQAFNRIASHIHGTTPPSSMKQCSRIV